MLDIIQKHRQKTGVPILVASKGNEPTRVKLYHRMFDKISTHKWETKMPGRTHAGDGPGSGDYHMYNWMI